MTEMLEREQLALPFCVTRNNVKSLVEQTLDGLRGAISCGYYKPGDVLPPMRVFTEQLGVSRIVMNEVIARLKKDGLVNARPRVGCVVLDSQEKLWKGRVLLVNPIGDDNYYNNVYAGVIRDALVGAGYLFLSCTVPQLETKEYDLSVLEHFLQRSMDLVVLTSLKQKIVETVARTGVRYVTISQFGQADVRPPCASAVIDWNAAMPELVADLRTAGVRFVEQVSWVDTLSDALSALTRAGISVRSWKVVADHSVPRIQAVKEAGYRAFAQRLSSPHPKLPEVFFFTDDRLAEGAFLALAEAGLHVPDDVGVVTWSNYGSGPVFGKELSRMEMNPYADGHKSAAWLLDILKGRGNPGRLVFGPTYISGKTLNYNGQRRS